VNFISAGTHAHFRLIEKRNGFSLPREQIEGFEPEELEVAADPTGGIKGKRPNKKDKLRAAAARAAGQEPPPPAAKEKKFSWPRLR